MSLADTLNVPEDDQQMLIWSFYNAELHTQTILTIEGLGTPLQMYILDPIPGGQDGLDDWLQRHQQAHDDVNEQLNISGADLSAVDFNNREQLEAWIRLHFTEHVLWNQSLGI